MAKIAIDEMVKRINAMSSDGDGSTDSELKIFLESLAERASACARDIENNNDAELKSLNEWMNIRSEKLEEKKEDIIECYKRFSKKADFYGVAQYEGRSLAVFLGFNLTVFKLHGDGAVDQEVIVDDIADSPMVRLIQTQCTRLDGKRTTHFVLDAINQERIPHSISRTNNCLFDAMAQVLIETYLMSLTDQDTDECRHARRQLQTKYGQYWQIIPLVPSTPVSVDEEKQASIPMPRSTQQEASGLEQKSLVRKQKDLDVLLGLRSVVQAVIDGQPMSIKIGKEIGEACRSISWSEDDKDCIRNKHGFRNRHKDKGNAINTAGLTCAKFPFESLAHLNDYPESKRFKSLWTKNAGELKTSVVSIKNKIDGIFNAEYSAFTKEQIARIPDEFNENISSNKKKFEHKLKDFASKPVGKLELLSAFAHDIRCVESIINWLSTFNALESEAVDLNSREVRYQYGYLFSLIGETAKEISDYLKPEQYNDVNKNKSRYLFTRLGHYRQEIKNHPNVVQSDSPKQLMKMKNMMSDVGPRMKGQLGKLLKNLNECVDSADLGDYYNSDKKTSSIKDKFEVEYVDIVSDSEKLDIGTMNIPKRITQLDKMLKSFTDKSTVLTGRQNVLNNVASPSCSSLSQSLDYDVRTEAFQSKQAKILIKMASSLPDDRIDSLLSEDRSRRLIKYLRDNFYRSSTGKPTINILIKFSYMLLHENGSPRSSSSNQGANTLWESLNTDHQKLLQSLRNCFSKKCDLKSLSENITLEVVAKKIQREFENYEKCFSVDKVEITIKKYLNQSKLEKLLKEKTDLPQYFSQNCVETAEQSKQRETDDELRNLKKSINSILSDSEEKTKERDLLKSYNKKFLEDYTKQYSQPSTEQGDKDTCPDHYRLIDNALKEISFLNEIWSKMTGFSPDNKEKSEYQSIRLAAKMSFGIYGQICKELMSAKYQEALAPYMLKNSILSPDLHDAMLVRHKHVCHDLLHCDEALVDNTLVAKVSPWRDTFAHIRIAMSDRSQISDVGLDKIPKDFRLFAKKSQFSELSKKFYNSHLKMRSYNEFLLSDLVIDEYYGLDLTLDIRPELAVEIHWQASLAYRNKNDFQSVIHILSRALYIVNRIADEKIRVTKYLSLNADLGIAYSQLEKIDDSIKHFERSAVHPDVDLVGSNQVLIQILLNSGYARQGRTQYALANLELLFLQFDSRLQSDHVNEYLSQIGFMVELYLTRHDLISARDFKDYFAKCLNDSMPDLKSRYGQSAQYSELSSSLIGVRYDLLVALLKPVEDQHDALLRIHNALLSSDRSREECAFPYLAGIPGSLTQNRICSTILAKSSDIKINLNKKDFPLEGDLLAKADNAVKLMRNSIAIYMLRKFQSCPDSDAIDIHRHELLQDARSASSYYESAAIVAFLNNNLCRAFSHMKKSLLSIGLCGYLRHEFERVVYKGPILNLSSLKSWSEKKGFDDDAMIEYLNSLFFGSCPGTEITPNCSLLHLMERSSDPDALRESLINERLLSAESVKDRYDSDEYDYEYDSDEYEYDGLSDSQVLVSAPVSSRQSTRQSNKEEKKSTVSQSSSSSSRSTSSSRNSFATNLRRGKLSLYGDKGLQPENISKKYDDQKRGPR